MKISELLSQIGLHLSLLNGRKEYRSLNKIYKNISLGKDVLQNTRSLKSEISTFVITSEKESHIRSELLSLLEQLESRLLSKID